jgi:hypothetical protein
LPNQSDCGGRLEARPISQPRCQRTIAEGIRGTDSGLLWIQPEDFVLDLRRTEYMLAGKFMIYLLIIITLFIGCAHAHCQLNNKQQELAQSLAGVTDDYLAEHIGKTGFGGKTFCTYKTLAIEETTPGVNEYLFAVCQEYYPNDGRLKKGTGIKLPVVLSLQKENQIYRVVGHKTPRDGSQYWHDIETLFPARTHEEIDALIGGPNFWREELEKKASKYFQQPVER